MEMNLTFTVRYDFQYHAVKRVERFGHSTGNNLHQVHLASCRLDRVLILSAAIEQLCAGQDVDAAAGIPCFERYFS